MFVGPSRKQGLDLADELGREETTKAESSPKFASAKVRVLFFYVFEASDKHPFRCGVQLRRVTVGQNSVWIEIDRGICDGLFA